MRLASTGALLTAWLTALSLVAESACMPVEANDSYEPGTKSKKKKTPGEETEEEGEEGGNPGSAPTTPGGETTLPTPDGGVTPAGNGTKGTGGPIGAQELRSTGGLSYRINAPAPGTQPRGLLVLLHGSGASNYTTFVDKMQAVAQQHDLIRVSVLAPNGQGWNEGGEAAAADKLHQLIQQDIFPKYDIDTTKILFSGQSSGGGFLATHFIPLHAKDYRGGAFLQCGAAPPRVAFTPETATKQNFKLHFEITTGDTIWPASYRDAVAQYTQSGMQLTQDATKPGGHCAFDQQAVIQAHISFILAAR